MFYFQKYCNFHLILITEDMVSILALEIRDNRMILGVIIILLAINEAFSVLHQLHYSEDKQTVTKVKTRQFGCDVVETVGTGEVITVTNPGWPNAYSAGAVCRWVFLCPGGRCRLLCDDVGLPQSKNCFVDKLLVSNTGSPGFYDAKTICGRQMINIKSIGSSISIGLKANHKSPGGRFRCEVRRDVAETSEETVVEETNTFRSGVVTLSKKKNPKKHVLVNCLVKVMNAENGHTEDE